MNCFEARPPISEHKTGKLVMKKLLIFLLCCALPACATPTTPPPDHATASAVAAPNVSFSNIHTFEFGTASAPRPGYETTPRSLEVQQRLRGAVKSALEARGFTEVTEKPDVTIKLAAGSGSGASTYREEGPALGFIGIDIFSVSSGNQIWKGAAFAEIDPTKIDDALLRRGVEHMLQGFGSEPETSVSKPQ
jgi:spore coat protein U-like protein